MMKIISLDEALLPPLLGPHARACPKIIMS